MKNNHIDGRTTSLDVSLSTLRKELGELENALKEVPYVLEDTIKSNVGKYYSWNPENHVSYISFGIDQRHKGDFENLEYKILVYADLPKEKNGVAKRLAHAVLADVSVLEEYYDKEDRKKYIIGDEWRIVIRPLKHVNTPHIMIKGTIQEIIKLTKIVETYTKKTKQRTMHDAEHPGLREMYGKH